MNMVLDPIYSHEATGQGEPTLVFVHGFACAREDWTAQINHFKGRYRCVGVDLPGHGGSPVSEGTSNADLAAGLNLLRKRLEIGKVVLIGHSLGVRVVIDAYLQAPENVLGLVFVDGRFYDGDPIEVEKRTTALVDEPGYEGFVQRNFGGMFTPESSPELKERIIERALKLDPRFAREVVLESILWDSTQGRDSLKRIAVPVLQLQATNVDVDRQLISLQPGMRTGYMDLVEELVANSSVIVVPGVGHFAMIEAADAVNREIDEFLNDVV
jgi:pimeloyl-ACP methyl ester carboxylesterase